MMHYYRYFLGQNDLVFQNIMSSFQTVNMKLDKKAFYLRVLVSLSVQPLYYSKKLFFLQILITGEKGGRRE